MKETAVLTKKYVDMILEDSSSNEGWEGLSFILEELEEINNLYQEIEEIEKNLKNKESF